MGSNTFIESWNAAAAHKFSIQGQCSNTLFVQFLKTEPTGTKNHNIASPDFNNSCYKRMGENSLFFISK